MDLQWSDGRKDWSATLTANRATEFQVMLPPDAKASNQTATLTAGQTLRLLD